MKHRNVLVLLSIACLTSLACRQASPQKGKGTIPKSSLRAQRIGVYDSRAIAIAYCGTDFQKRDLQPLKDAMQQAKQKGDKALIERYENQIREEQNRLHRQGFSTAPVDDILAHIQDRIPDLLQQANVTRIVSKWDQESLSQYPEAESADVTDLLVAAFHPNQKQLKYAQEIQNKEPIPLSKIDKMMKEERH